MQSLLQPVVLALVSATVGSFLALTAARSAKGEQWLTGRSRCDACHTPLSWPYMLPIVGYVVARGRCRMCEARIAPIWVAVEGVAALGAAMAWLRFEGDELVAALLLGWQLLLLSICDALTGRLPRAVNLGLGISGLLAALRIRGEWLSSVAGLALAASMLAGVSWLYRKLRGHDGLGLGDILMFGAAGSWLGPSHLAPALLIGALTALGYVWLRAKGGTNRIEPLRFAPALACGIWISYLYVT